MKTNLRSFVAGCLVTASLVGLITGAAATVGRQSINVDYNNIKVTLNGEQVNLVDANGKAVEPFAIDGTTYLPVRAVSNALGLDVGWDASTTTVELSTKSNAGTTAGTVVMDENGIKITFLGFEAQQSYLKGYKINLKIENSSSRDYTVQVRNLSVNGIMADSVFSSDVAAGKTSNDYIWIMNMEERGITPPVTEAEFSFHVFDTDDWASSFDSSVVTVK